MKFKCTETIPYPLSQVWDTTRDYLLDIALQQDDIAEITVNKRAKKAPDSLLVLSTWRADPSLPAFLKGFIKPEMLIWTEEAVWDNANHACHFTIHAHYKIEDISSTGDITFIKSGAKATRATYSGTFTVTKTDQSSIFMTGFIIRGIEALAAKLIEINFAKVVKAIAEHIKAQE